MTYRQVAKEDRTTDLGVTYMREISANTGRVVLEIRSRTETETEVVTRSSTVAEKPRESDALCQSIMVVEIRVRDVNEASWA